MSNLWYREIPVIPPAECLPDAMKEFLGNQIWETEEASLTAPVVIREDNMRVVGFLEGLAATGVEGASQLLEAIREGNGVTVWIGTEDSDDPFSS
jgi:hypothetical protein